MEDGTRWEATQALTADAIDRPVRRKGANDRHLPLAVCLGLLAIFGPVSDLRPQTVTPTDRVRSTDGALATLIDQGTGRSETFRRLMATILASRGIVYVEPGSCGHRVRACLKIWMHVSAGTRFLRIVIHRSTSDTDVQIMAAIGHELQHAIEVLNAPSVKDGVTMFNFLKRTAPTDGTRFETTAAINVGNAVYDELRREARLGR